MSEQKFDEVRCTVCQRKVRAEQTESSTFYTVYKCPNVGPEGEVHYFNVPTLMNRAYFNNVKPAAAVLVVGGAIASAGTFIYSTGKAVGKAYKDNEEQIHSVAKFVMKATGLKK